MFSINPKFSTGLLGAAVFSLIPLAASGQRVIDFSDLSLSPESYYNGSDGAGQFSTGGATFNNDYDSEYGSWGGWAYSNVSDTETTGWDNQYSAIPGQGVGESDIYGVGYVDTFTPTLPRIDLPEGETVEGIQVTNSTYSYYAMRDGDDFSKKFGGESGDDPDFFVLTIDGLAEDGTTSTGSVDFYLADYRSEENVLIDDWSWVDLTSLGGSTRSLEFTLDSSDAGTFGINTPAYFAMGEMTTIPEPSSYALWGGLLMGAGVLGRRALKRR